MNGTNPHTTTFGDEADISNMCKFGWYEWFHYFNDSKVMMLLLQKACLGHVLGPAKNGGNGTTQWILKDNGKIIPRRRAKNLTTEHLGPSNEIKKGKLDAFGNIIRYILGNSIDLPPAAPDLK